MVIVLPLDGSEVSESALGFAARLAVLLSAELIALRVTHPIDELPATNAFMAQDLAREEREAAHEYLERIASLLPRGSTRVAAGRPAVRIAEVAREVGAGLIVMASHGRSGAARWVLGSVAEGVLRQAPCPVLLCRGNLPGEFGGFERVVVPLDGSSLAARALEQVQPFLAPAARPTLVRATDTLVRLSALHMQPDNYKSYLEALEDELDAVDTEKRCERRVLDCAPAEAILRVAEEVDADLIAMTTHGRSGAARAVLGSVTERVARHALCPVMVFPTPPE